METRNLLIQIALLILGAIILFKVFQMDANQKIIKNNIEKSIGEIQDAEENVEAAQEKIANLEKAIERFKVERDLLETQKDSIVLHYRRKQAKDWEELQEIKVDIQENIDKIKRLRELNQRFE